MPTLRLNGRFVQEWPQGGFLCYWAYFTSVVVYKPFTVMLFLMFKDPPAGAGGCGYIFPREREKDAFST